MAPFYGWNLTASRLQPLLGGSLLFTTGNLLFRKLPYNLGGHISVKNFVPVQFMV